MFAGRAVLDPDHDVAELALGDDDRFVVAILRALRIDIALELGLLRSLALEQDGTFDRSGMCDSRNAEEHENQPCHGCIMLAQWPICPSR